MQINLSYNRLNTYGLILIFLPIFKPVGLANYTILNEAIQVWKLLSLSMIFLVILPSFRKIKINIGIIGLLIFWFIYILNIFKSKNMDFNVLYNSVISILLIQFITYEANRNNLNSVLKALNIIFTLYIWIQFISIIIVRSNFMIFGTIPHDYIYFLGTDNYSSFALLPMIGIVIFNSILTSNKHGINRGGWLYIIAYIIFNLCTKSYTAMLSGIIMFLLMLIYNYKKKLIKIFSIKTVLLYSGVILFLIVIFNIQDLFSYFLEVVLNKGLTLNSRTIIWEYAIRLIYKRPLFGFGTFSSEQLNSFILYGTTHAHNIFLELLLRTGIIGTIGYLLFMTWPVKYMKEKKLRNLGYMLVIFYIGQIVLFFMDFYPTIQYFYCYMAILYNFNKLILNEER